VGGRGPRRLKPAAARNELRPGIPEGLGTPHCAATAVTTRINHTAGGPGVHGLGREGGRVGIEEFLEYQYLAMPVR
jgi:hypothetical protein